MSSVIYRIGSWAGIVAVLVGSISLPAKQASALSPAVLPGVGQVLQSAKKEGITIKPTLEPSLKILDKGLSGNNLRLCVLPCANDSARPNVPVANAPTIAPQTRPTQPTPTNGMGLPGIGTSPSVLPQQIMQLPQQVIQQGLQIPQTIVQTGQPMLQPLMQLPQQLLILPQQILQPVLPAGTSLPIVGNLPSTPMASPVPMATSVPAAPMGAIVPNSSPSPAAIPGMPALPPGVAELIHSGKITPTQLQQVVSLPQVQQFLGTPQGQQFLNTPQGQNLMQMYQQSLMR
jgi:hypothetical protein